MSSDIVQNLRELVNASTFGFQLAKVISVSDFVCSVETLDNVEIENVRLNAQIDGGKGVVLTPKIGSKVIMTTIDDVNFFIVQYSELEKVDVFMQETTIVITQDELVVNDGKNGGVCITPELFKNLKKLTARVDGIIDAINTAVPVAQDGGAMLQTSMKTKLATLQDKEDFSKIENEKVKH